MESNNYESFITQTVESMFPRFTYRHLCFTMRIQMDWHYYPENAVDEADEKSFHKTVLLVFNRPSNYTKVLYKEIDRPFYHDRDVIVMDQLSDHDSCWRSDGMRWVFKTFCEAWEYFEQFGIEGRDISPHFGYDLIGSPAYHRLEKMEKTDPRDDRCFTYNVKIGKKITLSEIGKYLNDPENSQKLWDLEEQEKAQGLL